MASLQGGPGPELDDTHDVDSRSSDSGLSDSSQESSASRSCRWQTTEFHDQECSRFFDCPTHQIERRLLAAEDPADEEQEEQGVASRLSNLELSADRDGSPATATSDEPQAPVTRPTVVSAPPTSTVLPTAFGSLGLGIVSPMDDDVGPAPTTPSLNTHDDSVEASVSPRSTQIRPPVEAQRAQEPNRGGREDSFPPTPVDEAPSQTTPQLRQSSRRTSEIVLPRWQPDVEVTYCPICHSQFNIFVRKHHCRKCGRVVCNSCSPHRIIIPHQYIVRPPGYEIPLPQSLLIDGLGGGYFDVNGLSGGERVRLCNPCVPDPNTAPPQSPAVSQAPSPRSTHHRSRSSMASSYSPSTHSNRYSAVITTTPYDNYRYSSRTRSITMMGGPSSRHGSGEAYQPSFDRIISGGASSSASSSYPARMSSLGVEASSSRQRALPPAPQIAEEDECPICHRELPSRDLPNFEEVREAHVTTCILTHSTYGSPRRNTGEQAPAAAPRRTGMYAYMATEKDCIDDAECTICLEEFTAGVRMARLECLCRFHYSCISAWFVNHPGRCPVHQHDGFGY